MLIALILIVLVTSVFSAIAGVGGGPILLACLPFFLPAPAIIPVHGVVRLTANVSRAWFGRRQILFAPLRQYLLGTLLGMVVGIWGLSAVSVTHIPLFISVYLLLNLWVPAFQRLFTPLEHFALIGFVQTLLSVFTGGSGPMDIAVLHKRYHDPHAVVSTSAAMMIASNLSKVVVYVWYGFAWRDYAPLLATLMLVATGGTWLGVRLRHRLHAAFLRPLSKYLLTVLALHMLLRYLLAA